MKQWTPELVRELIAEVRDDLKSGAIKNKQLDMTDVLTVEKCGTVGCIGGWMTYKKFVRDNGRRPMPDEEVENLNLLLNGAGSQDERDSLFHLFYTFPRHGVTNDQAVKAIDTWLDGTHWNPWLNNDTGTL